MTTSDALHWIGAVSLLLYGLASALKPRWIAGLMETGFTSGHGVSEFRIAHGGITGPLFALYVNHPLVFQLLGFACFSAALVRILSYLPDRPKLTIDYVLFLLAEIVVGVFLTATPS